MKTDEPEDPRQKAPLFYYYVKVIKIKVGIFANESLVHFRISISYRIVIV